MKSLNFKIPEDEAKHLKDVAESKNMTMTALLRVWIARLKVGK